MHHFVIFASSERNESKGSKVQDGPTSALAPQFVEICRGSQLKERAFVLLLF